MLIMLGIVLGVVYIVMDMIDKIFVLKEFVFYWGEIDSKNCIY